MSDEQQIPNSEQGQAESPHEAPCSPLAEKLAAKGVFKGFHGLEGLVNSHEFWDKQPYGTRLYYGDGIADYLHRSILRTAVEILEENSKIIGPPAKLVRH